WGVVEAEPRRGRGGGGGGRGGARYPVPLPYGGASAPKGAGFYGEGTNLAHNLPLGANPHTDATAARHFNTSARRLWVPPDELRAAAAALQHHDVSGRPPERDHPLAHPQVTPTAAAP